MACTIRRPLLCPEQGSKNWGRIQKKKIEQKESKKSKGKEKDKKEKRKNKES